MESAGANARLAPSQNGTQDDASFRHISSLDTAFVAQVLGQVLTERHPPARPRYAEFRQKHPTALLLDRRI